MKALQGKTGWALLLAAAIAFPLLVPKAFAQPAVTLSVPLGIEIGTGLSWGAAH